MKKIITVLISAIPMTVLAQGATDVFKMSQSELRGTARFMSMAGAFGALGGDVSVLNQNPGGIGVYRSSDFCFTIDLDAQSAKTGTGSSSFSLNQTKINCNSVAYVGAQRFDTGALKNFNWGISYSRPISFNRHYHGTLSDMQSSMSTYIANCTNTEGWCATDFDCDNPYSETYAPWMSILAYNTFIINPSGSSFTGLMDDASTTTGTYEVLEKGYVDEYSLSFGGNVSHIVYWGMSLGVTHIDYRATAYYGETISNASIAEVVDNVETGETVSGTADYAIASDLHTFGDGFNFKLGVIVRPINELRLGFALHTPTYYSLTDEYIAFADGTFTPSADGSESYTASDYTNAGYTASTWYKIRTPWKYILSVATVLGGKGILSFDYEYQDYSSMRYLTEDGHEEPSIKSDIKNYYNGLNIFRVGAEYRVTSQVSVRAGYSYQDSPVEESAYNNGETIYTASITPAYTFDKSTQYITCGLGYRYSNFYADLAYVHKIKKGEYHAFSPYDGEESPTAKLSETSNRFALTLGVRF